GRGCPDAGRPATAERPPGFCPGRSARTSACCRRTGSPANPVPAVRSAIRTSPRTTARWLDEIGTTQLPKSALKSSHNLRPFVMVFVRRDFVRFVEVGQFIEAGKPNLVRGLDGDR